MQETILFKPEELKTSVKNDKKQQIKTENLYFKNCDYKILLKEMKEKGLSVDCILTDPPYNISRSHQLGFSNMGRSGMDYGSWDYGFNQTEWIKESLPFLKDGGSIIIFNDWKNLSYLVESLESEGYVVKDLLRWEKANPMPRNVNARYVIDFECAIWAVKGKKRWTFNKPKNVPYLRAIFKSGLVLGKNRIHPTQKSLQVIEELLKIHTNENDLVLDLFSGSATTALACLNLKRKFIGCEIDENYFKKAVKRLEN